MNIFVTSDVIFCKFSRSFEKNSKFAGKIVFRYFHGNNKLSVICVTTES